jgi:GntR family transcriptional regulator, transcriptional repressor for pyruvate dehydrogenase complex
MMTLTRIPTKSRSPAASDDRRLAPFRPLTAPRRLTHELVERLTAEITSGKLAPGARLPTEQEMIAATGVSRTVVREAVAALRAEGLVVTRQGAGAFVASGAHRPFRINAGELRSLREVLDAMELRTSIEIEAAGLAAERASPAQVRDIARALEAIDRAIAHEDSAVDQDFAFHCRIAQATGNPQFLRFLEYLGRFIIPRQTVRVAAGSAADRRAYLELIQKEHRDILRSIRAHAVQKARSAMRHHLVNSRKRYQKLGAALGDE